VIFAAYVFLGLISYSVGPFGVRYQVAFFLLAAPWVVSVIEGI